jgi:energy-converting hydrogenase Eha subunit G
MKLNLDLITTALEVLAIGLIVSGIFVLLGTGAGLIAGGIGLLALSYLASAGNE